MKPSQQFPKSAGWITARIGLKRGVDFTEQDAREFITFGKPHSCQFGLIEIVRSTCKIIYRENSRAALDPKTAAVEVDFDMHSPVPFVAKCGGLIVKVTRIHEEFLPLPLIRCQILAGKHFNDAGDYGPGDSVTIGPLIEDSWKILTFPDPVPA